MAGATNGLAACVLVGRCDDALGSCGTSNGFIGKGAILSPARKGEGAGAGGGLDGRGVPV